MGLVEPGSGTILSNKSYPKLPPRINTDETQIEMQKAICPFFISVNLCLSVASYLWHQ